MLETIDKPKRRLWFSLLRLFIVVTLALAGVFVLLLYVGSSRAIVRNASGVKLTNVRIKIRNCSGGEKTVEQNLGTLNPGESKTVWHRFQDPTAIVSFVLRGVETEFDSEYITDLWTGEAWVHEIRPDGTVWEGRDIDGWELKNFRFKNPGD